MTFEPLAKARPAIELRAFARNYFAQGGTLDAWIQAGRDAAATTTKLDEGHILAAENSQAHRADVQPPPIAGHEAHVREDQPSRAGDGLAGAEAGEYMPVKAGADVPPAREPSDAYIRAAAQSRMETARVMLEVHQTSDGRRWGAIKPREFPGMMRDGKLAAAIGEAYGPFSPKQSGMELRLFLPDEVFRKALAIARQPEMVP